MLTEAQVAERWTGLGGSDAAPALGMSPWKTPLELFLEKREHREAPDTERMMLGRELEPVIRTLYARRTGRTVRLPSWTLRHPQYPWMIAHLDGATDDRRIFEAKNVAHDLFWGPSGSDEIPEHYHYQVQHYLAVTGFEVCDVAALIAGCELRIYTLQADREVQEALIEGEQEFWSKVQANTPPPVNYTAPNALELVRRLHPGTNGQTLIANAELEDWRRTYEHADERMKNYEHTRKGALAHMLWTMGEAARMQFGNGMQLQRKRVQRKGYTVEPTEYIDSRFTKIKEE
jgi:putative phage-type endonuclease